MAMLGGLPGMFFDAFGSPAFGFLGNMWAAEQQHELNQQAQAQQAGMFGKGLGMFGFGGIPGVNAVPPPPGMDLGQLPGQAQTLAGQLSQQSQQGQTEMLQALGQLGPQGKIMRGLKRLPGQQATMSGRDLRRALLRGRDITGQFQTGAEGLRSQFGAGAEGITGGFEDRLGRAMGMLEGRGAQAEEDISTRFRESLGAQQQDLRARGFGGTMAANIARGSAAGESAEQRRLQEQLRGERLGLFSDLSGQGLAARERLLGAGTGLGQQLLSAGTNLQTGFANQQFAGGQANRQLIAGLGLSTLGQQGMLGQFSQEQLGQIRQQNLSNQFGFGQYPIGVGQQVGGQALGFLGPGQIPAPQQLQYAQVLPSVR